MGSRSTLATSARDLGLVFVPGNRRNASLQAKRVRLTAARFKNFGRLAKVNKKARCFIRTGAHPQALWGHSSIGVPPSRISALRTLTAASTGITCAGRCRNTAIALAIGPGADPGWYYRCQRAGCHVVGFVDATWGPQAPC